MTNLKAKMYAKMKDKESFSNCFLSKESLVAFNDPKYTILPGFCDVHVHFREPGFSYKETIKTGSLSAASGGFVDVCTMPNLNPVPDSVENLRLQTELIKKNALVGVHPYGAITVGEKGEMIADLEGMAGDVIAFSDDGRGVQDVGMMREAMQRARAIGKMIVAHCEVNDLLFGGYIHDGEYARAHGHRGICSESEWRQIERDLKLADETGCDYHVCHISTKESVKLIRAAKADGVKVTCETGPHYLILCDKDLREHGRFKMNPPLRSEADRNALVEGVLDGTIDMIATDHAPHSREEKSRGLERSAFGIVGLETAFPLMHTHFVRTGMISMDRLTEIMCYNAREKFGLPLSDSFSVWSLDEEYTVDPEGFRSQGRATPFEGARLFGVHKATVYNGKIIDLT